MNERRDEEAVARLFLACGLRAERFVKPKEGKRPDFRVTGPHGELFICEVKSIRSTADQPVTNDTMYGAITHDVKVAVKQFAAVNSAHLVPNVLVWVTHNPRYNIHSFVDLVRGRVVVDGVDHACLAKQRFGRFDKHLRCVDLFVWVFSWGNPELFYNRTDERHVRLLARLLRELHAQECELLHEAPS